MIKTAEQLALEIPGASFNGGNINKTIALIESDRAEVAATLIAEIRSAIVYQANSENLQGFSAEWKRGVDWKELRIMAILEHYAEPTVRVGAQQLAEHSNRIGESVASGVEAKVMEIRAAIGLFDTMQTTGSESLKIQILALPCLQPRTPEPSKEALEAAREIEGGLPHNDKRENVYRRDALIIDRCMRGDK